MDKQNKVWENIYIYIYGCVGGEREKGRKKEINKQTNKQKKENSYEKMTLKRK